MIHEHKIKMLAKSLLSLLAVTSSFAAAEDKIINWRIQKYDDIEATVGDKITFNWNFFHDVSIHPSGTCDKTEAIEVGTSSGASYTFTENDIGEVTFVCNKPGHCFAGQILKVIVSKSDESQEPVAPPMEITPIKDIPQTAIGNGNFETLVAALGATDLVTPLSEPNGPFTVFAPTDEAFASISGGLITCLLRSENKDTLADILKYHVIAGKVLSTDLSDGLTATTLNGDDVVVNLMDGVKINDSVVSAVDVKASNGVIHVLDSVLIPSDIDVDSFLTSCQQQQEEEGECKKVSTQEDFVFNDFISKPWYAHMQAPTRFNPPENNYCVTAQYEVRDRPSIPWGYTVDVANKGRVGSTDGEPTGAELCAWEKNSSDPAKLGVAPCEIPRRLSGDFWVIRYNEDEGYAIISGGQPTVPSGNTGLCKTGKGVDQTGLWYFSRSPTRNETLISYLDDIAQNEEGFDTSVLLPVDHVGCPEPNSEPITSDPDTPTELNIVSDVYRIQSIGWFRSFYDGNKNAEDVCKNIIVLGVGTGMRTDAYDDLSQQISTESDAITFIADPNPWFLTKNSETRFARLASYVMENLETLVPACKDTAQQRKLIIGGHSASGGAAWRAIPLLSDTSTPAAGYIGLDLFRLEPDSEKIDIPTLNWGLTTTSCGVTTSNAAKAGYQATNAEIGRVFYQVNNDIDGLGHCDYTDRGCYGPVCAPSSNAGVVRKKVAYSVNKFIQSLYDGDFDKMDYSLSEEEEGESVAIKLFMNEDSVSRRITRFLRR